MNGRAAASIPGKLTAGGFIRVPIEEYVMGASYTFEVEDGGKLFRWTDQRASTIESDAAVFNLPEALPVER